MGVTSPFPLTVQLATASVASGVDIPIARELALDKIAASTGAITSGTLNIQVKRNGSVVAGPVAITVAGLKMADLQDIEFRYGDILRVESAGTAVGLADVYVTLWLRTEIN